MLQDMTVKVNRQCSDWDLVVEKMPFGVSAAMLFVAKTFATTTGVTQTLTSPKQVGPGCERTLSTHITGDQDLVRLV